MKKIFAGLLVLLITAACPVEIFFGGGRVSAVDTSLFYQGGILSLSQPEVQINRIYGIKMTPLNVTIKSGAKEIYIGHTIENLSNTTNKIYINITYVSEAKGWAAALLLDENGDGIHQAWENKPLEQVVELSEGAILHFLLKLSMPADAMTGDAGSAIIKVSCAVKDGEGYVGYDGVFYGGEDEVETTDTVVVKRD